MGAPPVPFHELPVEAVLPKTQELFDELMQIVQKLLPPRQAKPAHDAEESDYSRSRFA